MAKKTDTKKPKKDTQKVFPWWSKKTPLKRTKENIKSMSNINDLNYENKNWQFKPQKKKM